MAKSNKDINKSAERQLAERIAKKKAQKAAVKTSKRSVKAAVRAAYRVTKMAVKMVVKAVNYTFRLMVTIGWPAFLVVILLILLIPGIKTAATLGEEAKSLFGLTEEDLSFVEDINPKTLAEIQKAGGEDLVYATFDCSNLAPADRDPGFNCIEGLLARFEGQGLSPVPERAHYLVPIYQAAGKKYQIPWELLAAVNGARTSFGADNCDGQYGQGFFRRSLAARSRFGVEAGSTPLEAAGLNCYRVDPAVVEAGPQSISNNKKNNNDPQSNKPEKPKATVNIDTKPLNSLPKKNIKLKGRIIGNSYDPVDAIFTDAFMLARNGAFKTKDWNYSGSPSDQCTTSRSDGKIWYVPQTGLAGFGAGAKMGYNKKLQIPRSIVALAATYRSNKGKYKPRRDGSNEDASLGRHPIPKKDLIKMLTAAWSAFGVRGAELSRNVTANYAQIGLESGGRPYILQGYIGDVNDNNPAGGLMQFIPSTFDHWKVDGFNDRFNPIDNILATVNAQVNGPYPILNGSSGWSPPMSENPYATGGKAEVVSANSTQGGKINAQPYKGKPQTDRVSKAVAFNGAGTNSDCYVAVVNDWFEAIKENPPEAFADIGGPIRQRIVAIAEAELKKNVSETGSDNVPRYRPSGKIAPYNIGAAWCQSFAAHVWYWAGIKQVNKLGGMVATDGLTVPSYTGAMTAAAQGNKLYGTYKTSNPLPGDMVFWSDSHVEIVTKVNGGRVIETIGGNTSDGVNKGTGSGATHYVSPPAKYGPANYKGTIQIGESSNPQASGGSSFKKLEQQTKSSLSIIVMDNKSDNTNTEAYGSLAGMAAWSTIKVPIVATLIRERNGVNNLGSQERQWAKAAIVESDNSAAAALYNRLGNNYSAARKVQRTLRIAGDNVTIVSKRGRDGFSSYGQTRWSAVESSRFYKSLVRREVLSKTSTNFIINLMKASKPADQKWGLGSAGFSDPAYKGGWGPKTNNKYLVRQTGIVKQGNKSYSITIIANPKNGSYQSGSEAVTKAARWIKGKL
jgi:hypothetical protein